jgi:hypothetical protein
LAKAVIFGMTSTSRTLNTLMPKQLTLARARGLTQPKQQQLKLVGTRQAGALFDVLVVAHGGSILKMGQ